MVQHIAGGTPDTLRNHQDDSHQTAVSDRGAAASTDPAGPGTGSVPGGHS